MRINKKFALGIVALALVLLVNFVSAADFSRTWNCGGTYKLDVGQPSADKCQTLYTGDLNCNIKAFPVLTEEQGASYKEGVSEATYEFDVSSAGKYSCNVTAIESGYGNHAGSPQTNENIEIFLNDVSLGKTTDPYCNTNNACADCRQSSSSLSMTLDLKTQSNKLKIISGKSHGLKSVSISCDSVCVPETEICDGIDNDCDGQIDEGIADIISGTDVGECRKEIKQCASGSFQIVQTGIGPTTEICNNLDDDCDGQIDEGIVCDRCTDGQIINSVNSSYCVSNVFKINNSYFMCQNNDWDFFNSLIYEEDCSFYSENYGDYYCLDENTSARNLTIVNGICGEQGCGNESSTDVVDQVDCPFGCFDGSCVKQGDANLSVHIVYPNNGMIFVSNYSPYGITLNASASQFVNSWTINGVVYFNSGFSLSKELDVIFGINSFVVCGTNENGTDCDSVFVILRNDFNKTNTSLFIDIISPENKTYNEIEVLLNISSNGTGIWYDFNGESFIYNGTTFLNSLEGWNNLTAYAIDNEGNVVSDYVVFFVDLDDDDDDDDGEGCRGCRDSIDEEEFDGVFMDDSEGDYGYLNITDGSIHLSEKDSKEFFGNNLIYLFLILIIILATIIIVKILFSF